MKFLTKISFCLLLSHLGSCNTNNGFVSEKTNAWIRDSDRLFYCRANVQSDGSVDPTCFEAGFKKIQ